MKRSTLLRIVILFVAILLAGGYVGYRAWSAASAPQTEKAEQPHFYGTKSAEIVPSESVTSPAPSEAPDSQPLFHGSKSAPVFKSPPKTQQQIASPSKG